MDRLMTTRGKRAASVALLVLAAGCASGPKKANDSAIDLGRKVVMDSVPLAGLAVQAIVGGGAVQDKGAYRSDAQRFCVANAGSLGRARQAFGELCAVKGSVYDGRFCRKAGDGDEVAFMAKFDSAGNSGCYTLTVAEPVGGADAAAYLGYLVEQGYMTAARRQQELKARQDLAQTLAETQQRIQETRRRAEEARLAVELPAMKKRGTQVCKLEGDRTLAGFVEDFTDEKLKVLVTGGYLTRTPSVQIQVPPGSVTWDYFVGWRLC
jgi:hypothetical protein